jgi:hypothetical protein
MTVTNKKNMNEFDSVWYIIKSSDPSNAEVKNCAAIPPHSIYLHDIVLN